MTEIAAMHQRLLDDLAASGKLSEAWQGAFAAVLRHQFIPDTIWGDSTGELLPLRHADNPRGWLDAAYALDAVITQVDDGHPTGPGGRGRYVTSSASRPDVVALMLTALNAHPGMRILEIGTGTGYNAALLAHRLGATNVTSVEIDPTVAEHARTALAATGYPVAVITGDGAHGYLPHAPYDRIIATAAVHQVPYPWVAQTRPGGTIITPWASHYHNGALVSLTVNNDGTAEGSIVGNVAFMELREQRFRASIDDEECDESTARHSHTSVAPSSVAGDYDASLAIGMKVPHCAPIHVSAQHYPDRCARFWFADPANHSWANVVDLPDAPPYPVHQSGPRDLWDEIEAAYHWWLGAGCPGPQRWRITITPEGQQADLTQTTAHAGAGHPNPQVIGATRPGVGDGCRSDLG
ncbi:MAG: methyltransferase domain-containing protein [Pseudonocardiaceae bacterium]